MITDVYEKFGFEISPEFGKTLAEAERNAANYKSKHAYSLRKMGLSRKQILKTFAFVFKRFGFSTH
jgi:hypothetical protein